jgi:hypothetical protein
MPTRGVTIMNAGSAEPARRIVVEPVRRPTVAPAEPAPLPQPAKEPAKAAA